MPQEISCYVDRTFTFDESDNLSHRIFWRYRYEHVHVIRHHMPFNNLTFPAMGQILENLSKVPSKFTI